jgi:hypothetical protein
VWGNTFEESVDLAQNNIPGIMGDEWEWYPLWRHNSVPRHLSEIQYTPLLGHPALTSAFEPILVTTIPRVAEALKSVVDKMTYGTDYQLINIFHADTENVTHEDLNTFIDEPDNRWNIYIELYHTLTSRVKQSNNG